MRKTLMTGAMDEEKGEKPGAKDECECVDKAKTQMDKLISLHSKHASHADRVKLNDARVALN